MSAARSRMLLLAACAAGLVSAFAWPEQAMALIVVVPLAAGAFQLVIAALLASGRRQPGRFGYSVRGTVLCALSSLSLGVMAIPGLTLDHVVGGLWAAGTVTLFLLGMTVENRAHARAGLT